MPPAGQEWQAVPSAGLQAGGEAQGLGWHAQGLGLQPPANAVHHAQRLTMEGFLIFFFAGLVGIGKLLQGAVQALPLFLAAVAILVAFQIGLRR